MVSHGIYSFISGNFHLLNVTFMRVKHLLQIIVVYPSLLLCHFPFRKYITFNPSVLLWMTFALFLDWNGWCGNPFWNRHDCPPEKPPLPQEQRLTWDAGVLGALLFSGPLSKHADEAGSAPYSTQAPLCIFFYARPPWAGQPSSISPALFVTGNAQNFCHCDALCPKFTHRQIFSTFFLFLYF